MVFKVPAAPENYLTVETDGVKLYVSKTAAQGTENIKFDLRGVWIFKELVATGLIYPKVM